MRHLILGNASGDLDSFASAYALARVEPLGEAVLNIPREELALRRDLMYLLDIAGIDPNTILYKEDVPKEDVMLTLVDHNRLAPDQEEWAPYVWRIIDHHHNEGCGYPKPENKLIQTVGSCATLISEKLVADEKQALLLLAAILVDTSNLEDIRKTTERDILAAERLKKWFPQGFSNSLFHTLIEKKGDVRDLDSSLLLKKDLKTYVCKEGVYAISSLPKSVEWTLANQKDWEPACYSLLLEKKWKYLFILEWVQEKRQLIVISTAEELYQNPFFLSLFESYEKPIFCLKEPLSRKELQPLLQHCL